MFLKTAPSWVTCFNQRSKSCDACEISVTRQLINQSPIIFTSRERDKPALSLSKILNSRLVKSIYYPDTFLRTFCRKLRRRKIRRYCNICLNLHAYKDTFASEWNLSSMLVYLNYFVCFLGECFSWYIKNTAQIKALITGGNGFYHFFPISVNIPFLKSNGFFPNLFQRNKTTELFAFTIQRLFFIYESEIPIVPELKPALLH